MYIRVRVDQRDTPLKAYLRDLAEEQGIGREREEVDVAPVTEVLLAEMTPVDLE